MRADARARRDRIIRCTCDLLRTTDPKELALRTVAEASQVGIATLYRHFRDHHSLLVACGAYLLGEVIREAGRAVSAVRAAGSDAEAEEAWKSFVWGLFDYGAGTLVPALAAPSAEKLPAEWEHSRHELDKVMNALVRAVQERGLADPSLTGTDFFADIVVLSRPAPGGLQQLNAEVNRRLISTYLAYHQMRGLPETDRRTAKG